MLPAARKYRMGVIVWSPLAGGWLSGKYRKDQPIPETMRAQRVPDRFDISLSENQIKLDVVERLLPLAEAEGVSLVELAVAWVLVHPAVTSAIIGPRTLEQLNGQIKAADVTLSKETLDRIDEIVAPGTTINPADNGYEPVWLQPWERRRPPRH